MKNRAAEPELWKWEMGNGRYPLEQILENVYIINNIGIAPAFLLVGKDDLTLIDTGMIGTYASLVNQISEKGFDLTRLSKIIITHCHCDHTGNAAKLLKDTNAKIYAHKSEIPFITQKQRLPSKSLFKRIYWGLIDRIYKTQIPKVDVPLEDNDIIDSIGGLRVIHIPGHTPGNIALHHQKQKLLFSSDIIYEHRGKILISKGVYSLDHSQLKKSCQKLLGLDYDKIVFGHGEPLLENGKTQVQASLSLL